MKLDLLTLWLLELTHLLFYCLMPDNFIGQGRDFLRQRVNMGLSAHPTALTLWLPDWPIINLLCLAPDDFTHQGRGKELKRFHGLN